MTAFAAHPTAPLWTFCDRCGAGPTTPSATDPRYCATCLPDPEIAADRARIAALRFDAATRRTRRGAAAAPDVRRDGETLRGVRSAARWLIAPTWTRAHIAVGVNALTACSKVTTKRGAEAPPGMAGCRVCAVSVGLTRSLCEDVMT